MRNKRSLKKAYWQGVTDGILFIAGCAMFGWYTSIFLEKLLS